MLLCLIRVTTDRPDLFCFVVYSTSMLCVTILFQDSGSSRGVHVRQIEDNCVDGCGFFPCTAKCGESYTPQLVGTPKFS